MLTIHSTEAIRQIEAAIGYTFHDKRLLVQVLTRKTYLKIDPEAPDNEVLEFYGDTLMNYHVTNYFMAKYAHMLEDGLFFMRTVEQFTDLRSHYVCNRYLTERVKAMGLARYLRAQNRESELRRDGEKAYADIFESLVGAIYLDSYQNDTLIRAFILRQLGIEPRRAPADIEAFDFDALRDLPEAVIEDAPVEEPDGVMLPDEPTVEFIPAPAESVDAVEEALTETVPETASLSEAVVEAVTEALPALVEVPVEADSVEEAPAPADETPAAPAEAPVPAVPATNREKLAALCESLGYEQPTYGKTPPNAPNARPVAACTLKYKDAKGKQVKISLNDSGRSLAEATEKVAAKMLAKVEKQASEADAKAEKTEKAAKPSGGRADRRTAVIGTPLNETAAPTVHVEEVSVENVPVEVAPVEEVLAEAAIVAEAAVEVAPAEAVAVETAPIEEPPVETAPVEEASVEVVSAEKAPAEVEPVEEAPTTETPTEVVPVEETPVAEAPTVVENPKKKPASKKKAPAKKKPAPAAEQPAEAVAEAIQIEEAKAEEVKAEEAKSAKKTPTKKKTATRKKSASAEAAPADTVSAETAPTEDKPTEAKKPRTRKPRAKKEDTPAADQPVGE